MAADRAAPQQLWGPGEKTLTALSSHPLVSCWILLNPTYKGVLATQAVEASLLGAHSQLEGVESGPGGKTDNPRLSRSIS